MKPEKWQDCPHSILEPFLWDLDLRYCPYDSSREETISNLLNGGDDETNKHAIQSAWNILSENDFQRRAKQALKSLEGQVAAVEKLLD